MPAEILRGAPVAEALSEQLKTRIRMLADKGVTPCLGMIRIGEREGDLSYERSASKRCGALGIAVHRVVLPPVHYFVPNSLYQQKPIHHIFHPSSQHANRTASYENRQLTVCKRLFFLYIQVY